MILPFSKQIIANVATVVAVYAIQILFHEDIFRCPCTHHTSYGAAFILAPVIFLLGFSLIVCKRSWSVLVTCWKYNNNTVKCNYFFEYILDIFQPFLAPTSWLIFAMFRGDYYVCIRGGPQRVKCNKNNGIKSIDFDKLYAQSFVIGSAFLIAVVIFATGIVCIQRFCTNNADCLPTMDDFHRMKSKAVAKAFDESSKEIANDFAVKLVESSFNVRDSEVDVDERFNIARDRLLKNFDRRGQNECMINCPENEFHSMEFTSMSSM